MVLAHDITRGDRTNDVKITQNITFETMLLAPDTMKGLKDSGFLKPSPIQLYGIPIGKCGFDLLLEAKSGTGKTAVFSIIALEKLDFSKGLQVVILTPTREIAAQICDVLKQIGSRYEELQVAVVMGGLPVQDDIEKFKKPVHIVVGSPGRLRHLMHHKHIDTKSVRLLVVDEADKLMENNFQSDIKYIHATLPKQKQVIMSSATYPQNSRDVINSYVQNASHVCPDSDCVLLGIDQKVLRVKYNNNIIRHTQDRFKELHKILGRLQFKQCLVFCNYQARVTEVYKLLKKEEWPSQKLHGEQEQVDRLDALKTLQQYKCRILVSTDLAARGIDASNIDLVINFEPPCDWQTYLHRIGRAGRFGSYGLAVTILSEGKEEKKFKDMFKSMNLSLNMRHLWSDNEFDIHTKEPELRKLRIDNSPKIDLLQNIPCKNIWELLSSKTNVMQSTATSESQLQFKDVADIPKIEPFSELMLSSKNEIFQDTVNILFKHMGINKKSINHLISVDLQNAMEEKTLTKGKNKNINKDNYNQLKVIKEVTSNGTNINDIKTNTAHKEKHDEINGENKALLNLMSVDSQNAIEEKIFIKRKNKNISKDDYSPYKDIKEVTSNATNINDIKINTAHKVKTDEINGKNKSLLKLGLPTTFSNSKLNHVKRKATKPIFENKTYNNTTSQDFKTNCFQSQIRKKSHTKLTEMQYGSETELEQFEKPERSYENENRSNNSMQQKFARLHTNKQKFEDHIKRKSSMNLYSMWYNELKMRMKYIEQAIYVDEISIL